MSVSVRAAASSGESVTLRRRSSVVNIGGDGDSLMMGVVNQAMQAHLRQPSMSNGGGSGGMRANSMSTRRTT